MLEHNVNVSLKSTITKWLFIFTIIPLLIASAIELYNSTLQFKSRAVEQVDTLLTLKSSFIQNWFDYRQMDIVSESDDPSVVQFMEVLSKSKNNSSLPLKQFVTSQEWLSAVQEYEAELVHFMADYDYIYDVFLISKHGDILYTIVKKDDFATNILTGQYKDTKFGHAVRMSVELKQLTFSGMESYAPSFGEKAGFMVQPLNNGTETVGFLAVQFKLNRILSILNKSANFDHTSVYLTNENGNVLTFAGDRALSINNVSSIPDLNTSQVNIYKNANDIEVLGKKNKIKILGVTWFLVTELKADYVFQASFDNTLVYGVILLFFSVIGWFGAKFVSNKLTNPLKKLADYTRQFAIGDDLHQDVDNEIQNLDLAVKSILSSRVKYEASLEQYKKRMELACQAAKIGVFELSINSKSMKWDSWSAALFEEEEEQDLYSFWSSLIDHNDKAQVYEQLELCSKFLNYLELDYRITTPSGAHKFIRMAASVFVENDKQVIIGINYDITEVKEKAFALAQNEKFLTLIIENIPDYFFVKDHNLKFLKVNEAFRHLYPKKHRDGIIGSTSLELFSEEDQRSFVEADRKALALGYLEFEETVSFPDGTTRVMLTKKTRFESSAGEPHILGLSRDITYLKEQQKALEMATERFKLAMSVSGSGVWDWDLENKEVYLSTTLLNWLRLPENLPKVCVGFPELIEPFFYEEDKQLITKKVRNALKHNRVDLELRLCLENGERFFRLSAKVFRDNSDKAVRVVGNLTDISSFKERQHFLEQAKQDAEFTSQAKSGFLAAVSHEIRTPMNGILGTLDILLSSKLDEQQAYYANITKNSATSLLHLLNDIMDFSKLEQNKLELESIEFNFVEVVSEVIASFSGEAVKKQLALSLDVSEAIIGCCIGDPYRLRQVMNNLINNAIKFTSSGYVHVSLSTKCIADQLLSVVLKVEDSGIGIALENQAKLFEAFTQADTSTTRQFGGTGLGLAIVKNIVDSMGGEVSLMSQEGKGSIFEVALSLPMQQEHKASHNVDLNSQMIVVIDEHAHSREFLTKQLKQWHAKVYAFSSSNEFIDYINSCSLQKQAQTDQSYASNQLLSPDVILFDEKELHGVNKIEERLDIEPIIYIMTYHLDDEMNTSLGTKLIQKPVLRQSLLNALCADEAPQRKVNDSILATESFNILVAEDNAINQIVTKSILSRLGHKHVIANDGKEALNILRDDEHDFDLILMDCQMPNLDGYSATKSIRQGAVGNKLCHIPIIAVTANAVDNDKNKCISAGMNDYISKPIDPDLLAEKIKHCMK